MIIAQISDSHIGSEGVNGERAEVRLSAMRDCVDHINSLTPQPDLVIHTGDMTHGGFPHDYKRIKAVLAALNAPMVVVPGNRDERHNMAEAFDLTEQVNGFIQYAVDDFPVRLVAVDTKGEGSKLGQLCDARLQQLAQLLGQESNKPTALFMHHPPFDVTISRDPFAFESRDECDALAQLLDQHPQVIRLFCGHSHRPYFTELAGRAASIVPAGPVDLQRGEYAEREAERPLYQLHRWDGQGAFETETVIVG